MKTIALAVMGAMSAMVAGSALAAAPDWSKVTERKIKMFYPGQSGMEWIMNKADHSAVPDIVDKKRACAKCHEGDADEIGDKIVAGKPVGASKTVLEPKPPAGKVGWIPPPSRPPTTARSSTCALNGYRRKSAPSRWTRRTKSS